MTPMFFGDARSPLLGVLDEPPAAAERGHGVLICPPIGHEHVRCHWALRQVGAALTRLGHHVLRFDWYGVGDSAGSLEDATVERWVEDVLAAAEELRDATGVRRLSVVGVRFGAAIAALAAGELRPQRFVMWDPVLSGDAWIDELRRLHAGALEDAKRFFTPTQRRSPPSSRPTACDELVGHRFSRALLRSIAAVTPDRLVFPPDTRVAWVASEGEAGPRAFSPGGRDVEARRSSATPAWGDPRRVDALFLPGDAPTAIGACYEAAS